MHLLPGQQNTNFCISFYLNTWTFFFLLVYEKSWFSNSFNKWRIMTLTFKSILILICLLNPKQLFTFLYWGSLACNSEIIPIEKVLWLFFWIKLILILWIYNISSIYYLCLFISLNCFWFSLELFFPLSVYFFFIQIFHIHKNSVLSSLTLILF